MLRTPLDLTAATAFAGMGVVALARPTAIPDLMGLRIAEERGTNEVRAVYGGFGLAMAGAILLGASETRAGARRAAGLALLGMAAGRVADLVLGGPPTPAAVGAMAGESLLGMSLVRSARSS